MSKDNPSDIIKKMDEETKYKIMEDIIAKGSKDDGGPAFPFRRMPTQEEINLKPHLDKAGIEIFFSGMTLRDYFAGQALISVLNTAQCGIALNRELLAEISFSIADAMLEARKQ